MALYTFDDLDPSRAHPHPRGDGKDDARWRAAQKAVTAQHQLTAKDGPRFWQLVEDLYQHMAGHSQPVKKSGPQPLRDHTDVSSDRVYDYLCENYPANVLTWVKPLRWQFQSRVPLKFIHMDRRPGGRDPAKVKGIAEAIDQGQHMEPVVLVDGPHGYWIADGYHRTLAFQHAGRTFITAYVAEVESDEGPWRRAMHDAKLNKSPAASGAVLGLRLAKASLADTSPDTAHAGVMVALYPSRAVAEKLALQDGETPEELHITLGYLGNVTDIPDLNAVRQAVRAVAEHQGPMDGLIGGWGRFTASDSSDGKDVIYASVDLPDLPAFRQRLVEAIDATGAEVRANHGFTPHMTLSYIEPDDRAPMARVESRPVSFDSVWLVVGEKRERFALTGRHQAASIRKSGPTRAEAALIEALAEAIHNMWMGWAAHAAESVDAATRKRWQPMFVPYDDLPEPEKQKDRVEAMALLDIVRDQGFKKSHQHVGRRPDGRFAPKDDPAAWQGDVHRWRKGMQRIGFLDPDRTRVANTEPDGLDVVGQETPASPPRPFPFDVPNQVDAPTSMAASQAQAHRQPLRDAEREAVRRRFGPAGCSFARDKDGLYCYTHRARSKSYPTVDAIPRDVVEFIGSTG